MKNTGRFLKKHRGDECLNCGVPLDVIDRYCHSCGQINTTKKLSLKDFFGEFFASIFSYDSRLRHTIIALLFNPGKISKEYIEGKRIKYANPFRFYLSISIIFFIINGLFMNLDDFSRGYNDGYKAAEKAKKNSENGFNFKINKNKESITITKDLDSIPKPDSKVTYYTETQLDTMNFIKESLIRFDIYQSHYEKTKQEYPNIALDSLKHKKTKYNRYLYKKGIRTKKLNEDPSELIKFILNKLPFIIFLFLPFFSLGIWLLYIRRPFSYMEHLIFTFHTQTLFFILLGIAILFDQITNNEIASGIAIIIFLFYLYKAMRKFYNQSRIKTIVKFLLVNVIFFILASIGIIVTFIGSLFTY
ncbi:DUF3667 domain-containing protein [Aquimarina sp. MMG016]|uniref:DUF3667 domain-containing protein n=1 Tax=Aquimarina sp. MMG016 TaxID=2822690 RepID=UPI001B39F1ED|nr:DUF3667 domain-containing protein [Aquimarina sp. MMG016]MBQ4822301.1 DUF3667 domain-containing protein [Aquimarina sp. MMG016]